MRIAFPNSNGCNFIKCFLNFWLLILSSVEPLTAVEPQLIWVAGDCEAPCAASGAGEPFSPVTVDSTLIYGCPINRVVALDFTTGERIWENPTIVTQSPGFPAPVKDPLKIGNSWPRLLTSTDQSMAYVCDTEGTIAAFDLRRPGRLLWKSLLKTNDDRVSIMLLECEVGILKCLSFAEEQINLLGLNWSTGEKVFVEPIEFYRNPRSNTHNDSRVVQSHNCAGADGSVFSFGETVASISSQTRKLKWQFSLDQDFGNVRAIYCTDMTVFVLSDSKCLALDGVSGEMKWKIHEQNARFVACDGKGVFLLRDGNCISVDVQSGNVNWLCEVGELVASGNGCVLGGMVLIPILPHSLVSIDKSLGTVIFRWDARSSLGSLFSVNGFLVSIKENCIRKFAIDSISNDERGALKVGVSPVVVDGKVIRGPSFNLKK